MRSFLLLLALAMPFWALSQSNYHKGSVTSNTGEVISGYINYREWEENPKLIEFKTNLADKSEQTFYPTGIRSFVINDLEKYDTYTGKISLNRTTFPELSYGKDTTSKSDVVFLKLVATGNNVTLYTYTDSLKTRYFVQEKQEQPFELLYQQYYVDNQNQITTSDTYRGQLGYLAYKYANANTNLSRTIQRMEYTNQIVTIVNNINDVTPVKSKVSGVRYYVGGAINFSQTSFAGQNSFTSVGKVQTISPKLSVGVDIFNNPYVQKFFFRIDLSFTYLNPKFNQTTPGVTSSPIVESYSFTQYNTTLTPQLVLNIYNKDALKIYLDLGASFNFSKYSNQSYTIAGAANVPYQLELSWVNFPLQAGVILNKRIEFFATYTAATAFTRYSDFSIGSQIYSTGIHYLFGKVK